MRHIPEDELHAYLDQALSRTQCVEIESHLAECLPCRTRRDDIAALRDRITALLNDLSPRRVQPPPLDELRARHEARTTRRRALIQRGAWAASLLAATATGWLGNQWLASDRARAGRGQVVAEAPAPGDRDPGRPAAPVGAPVGVPAGSDSAPTPSPDTTTLADPRARTPDRAPDRVPELPRVRAGAPHDGAPHDGTPHDGAERGLARTTRDDRPAEPVPAAVAPRAPGAGGSFDSAHLSAVPSTLASGPMPGTALDTAPLEREPADFELSSAGVPGAGAEGELDGIWRTVTLDGAERQAGSAIPYVRGLPVLQVQLQSSERDQEPIVAVDQQLATGELIRTIEGPVAEISTIISKKSEAPQDSARREEARRRNGEAIMAVRRGNRMLAITARLTPDSLQALLKLMRERSKQEDRGDR